MGGGVWPAGRGGVPAFGGAGDPLEGGAESMYEPPDSEVDDKVELGRGGGAKLDVGMTDAARGGGGVAVLAGKPERPGEAVWAREGGGGGTLGAASSGPAYRRGRLACISRGSSMATNLFVDPFL
jgi:hypothetical protein